MDGGTWQATAHRVERVGHDWATSHTHTHLHSSGFLKSRIRCIACVVKFQKPFLAGISPSGCQGASAHPSSTAPPPGPPCLLRGSPFLRPWSPSSLGWHLTYHLFCPLHLLQSLPLLLVYIFKSFLTYYHKPTFIFYPAMLCYSDSNYSFSFNRTRKLLGKHFQANIFYQLINNY